MVDRERRERETQVVYLLPQHPLSAAKHPKKKIGQSSSNWEEQTLLNLVAPIVLLLVCENKETIASLYKLTS